MAEFERDLAPVVETLLDGTFPELGDVPLTQVISFPRGEFKKASADKERLLAAELPASSTDIRTVYAAARLAFSESPARYGEKGAHELVMKKISDDLLNTGVRADVPATQTPDTYDLMRGREIVAFLRGGAAAAKNSADQLSPF
jgi:hypothetical protein